MHKLKVYHRFLHDITFAEQKRRKYLKDIILVKNILKIKKKIWKKIKQELQ